MKNEPVKKLKKVAYPIAIATAVAITAASFTSCTLHEEEHVKLDGDVPYQAQVIEGSDEEELAIPGEPAAPEDQIDLVGDEEVVEAGVPAAPDSELDCDGDDCDTDADTDCADGECVSQVE